jgi:hypothetical protein
MADSDPDVRWLTYSEAAAAMRVDRETVARRARRRKWDKQLGNDGKPRVAVPVSALPSIPETVRSDFPDTFPDDAADSTPSLPDMTRLENPAAALLALAERAARAEGEATALREAGRRLEEERSRAAADAALERDRAENALIRAAAAEAEAKGLREALAEVRRPFWRRWIG